MTPGILYSSLWTSIRLIHRRNPDTVAYIMMTPIVTWAMNPMVDIIDLPPAPSPVSQLSQPSM